MFFFLVVFLIVLCVIAFTICSVSSEPYKTIFTDGENFEVPAYSYQLTLMFLASSEAYIGESIGKRMEIEENRFRHRVITEKAGNTERTREIIN